MIIQKNWPALLAYTISVVVFLIVTVYAISYATGYRLDVATWTIQKTGVLAISSKPSGAVVYLNDKKLTRKTPITMRNMLPGEYALKLELPDYRPFFKTVRVESSQATEEHNLDLVLSEPVSQVVAEDVQRVVSTGDEVIYFSKAHKFIKISGGTSAELDFGRLPANVKKILQTATDVYLAKKSAGNTWALGVVSAGRRWLVMADLEDGYRGQLFSSPLNQVLTDKLTWLDNDRLMAVLGTTVYSVDLNLNRQNLYGKNILGTSYTNNRLYYVMRNKDGSYSILRDGNLFDDKAGEAVINDLPVGRTYDIAFISDERCILSARNNTTGLWLWDKTLKDKAPVWTKVASNVGEVWYEHSNLKPKLFYTAGRLLAGHQFKDGTEMALKNFPASVKLLGKRDESLFLITNNQINISDISGSNVYGVGDVNQANVFLNSDARKIWLQKANQLTEIVLRKNEGGLFGGLTHWWS